jgi:hypothetical protein
MTATGARADGPLSVSKSEMWTVSRCSWSQDALEGIAVPHTNQIGGINRGERFSNAKEAGEVIVEAKRSIDMIVGHSQLGFDIQDRPRS